MSMRYGNYHKPFPLSAIPVLNRRGYRDNGLRMPYFPEPVDVGAALPSGPRLYDDGKARRTYTATGQWYERPIGKGSARTSPAYTQFAGPDAPGGSSPPSRLVWLAVGIGLGVFGGNLLGIGRAGLGRVQRRLDR